MDSPQSVGSFREGAHEKACRFDSDQRGRPRGVQGGVPTPGLEQESLRCVLLDDLAALHDQHPVRDLDRAQPVGDDHRRPIGKDGLQRELAVEVLAVVAGAKAGPLRLVGGERDTIAPALSLRRSPLGVRARALAAGRLLRLDLHPTDFDRPRRVLALEAVLRGAASRRAVTYDELAAAPFAPTGAGVATSA